LEEIWLSRNSFLYHDAHPKQIHWLTVKVNVDVEIFDEHKEYGNTGNKCIEIQVNTFYDKIQFSS